MGTKYKTKHAWKIHDVVQLRCEGYTYREIIYMVPIITVRHNEHDSVSNYQPHVCLLNRLFRHRSKKTSKLRATGPCAGNSPGTGEFPAQMTSNAKNVSIWWRHHEILALRESDTYLNIGPGHVRVSPCNNSLPEPMVTGVRVTIPWPKWVNGLPVIAYYPPMDQWMEVSRQTCIYEYIHIYIYIYIHTYLLVLYTHTHTPTDMAGVGIMNQNIILEARHNKDVGSGR